ncbi:MAG: DUF362 domain-containing protein [Sedimentisphaerales bacterium]|nr:DUF362 domain-containing protein [Sedimentisphaerales bacterium]
MPDEIVSLTRCDDYSQPKIARAIARQFELLGGLEKFVTPGDTVLLKPNFIAPRPRHCATQTDPAVLIETARLLKDFGARPFIGDSPAWGNVFACIKALKLEDDLKRLSIPVRQLNKPKRCRIGAKNIEVGISSVALDADVIINMPKFKTHQQLVTTFAVKNMFGCVSGKRKALWHFAKGKTADRFCKLLIEIYKFLNPVLTIIDAVTVMDGPGPIRGRARPLGYLLGGTDPFALEVICSTLVNIKPEDISIIRTAKQMGLNCPDANDIKILGDPLPQPCMDFELPQLIPIRFSLPHVCKSICKQILILAKFSGSGKP